MASVHFHALALSLALLSACAFDPRQPEDRVARIDFGSNAIRIQTLGYYSAQDALQTMAVAAPRSPAKLRCGFHLYRLSYPIAHPDGRTVTVSGLMALPDLDMPRGLVSYQHGTTPNRKQAPSSPSFLEGLGSSSLFAADGYILIAADYIGLGLSMETPTYMHNDSTVAAVLGLIDLGAKALKGLSGATRSNLFLVGFSQGGTVNAAVHREIERTHSFGLALRASASIAGAFNLRGLEWQFAIENKSLLYMGYLANAYALVYRQSLSSIVKSPWDQRLPSLFDGSRESSYIGTKLPKNPEDLFTSDVFAALSNNSPHWFTSALASNETFQWAPRAPLRLYYGTSDKNVSPEESKQAAPFMQGLGGNAVAVCVGAHDHGQTALVSLPYVQAWFDEF